MKGKKLVLATVVTFFFLVVLNATVFWLLFPDGPPERFQNMRPSPLFQMLAVVWTAVLWGCAGILIGLIYGKEIR